MSFSYKEEWDVDLDYVQTKRNNSFLPNLQQKQPRKRGVGSCGHLPPWFAWGESRDHLWSSSEWDSRPPPLPPVLPLDCHCQRCCRMSYGSSPPSEGKRTSCNSVNLLSQWANVLCKLSLVHNPFRMCVRAVRSSTDDITCCHDYSIGSSQWNLSRLACTNHGGKTANIR